MRGVIGRSARDKHPDAARRLLVRQLEPATRLLPDVCPRAGTAERVLLAVTAGVRAPLLSLTARAADVSLRLPPSRWLLAGAKPPPGPSPRSPVPADRLLRGATGTGSVSLTPGPPNGPRGAGHRLRRVPPDTFSPCRDSTSDGDVADRSIQWVSPASARVSCAFAVPRGTGTDEARHVADWTRGLARSENPAPPRNLSRAAETSPALRGPP